MYIFPCQTRWYCASHMFFSFVKITFCDILINRSQPHLTALYVPLSRLFLHSRCELITGCWDRCAAYQQKYKSLSKVVKSELSVTILSSLLTFINPFLPPNPPFLTTALATCGPPSSTSSQAPSPNGTASVSGAT